MPLYSCRKDTCQWPQRLRRWHQQCHSNVKNLRICQNNICWQWDVNRKVGTGDHMQQRGGCLSSLNSEHSLCIFFSRLTALHLNMAQIILRMFLFFKGNQRVRGQLISPQHFPWSRHRLSVAEKLHITLLKQVSVTDSAYSSCVCVVKKGHFLAREPVRQSVCPGRAGMWAEGIFHNTPSGLCPIIENSCCSPSALLILRFTFNRFGMKINTS